MTMQKNPSRFCFTALCLVVAATCLVIYFDFNVQIHGGRQSEANVVGQKNDGTPSFINYTQDDDPYSHLATNVTNGQSTQHPITTTTNPATTSTSHATTSPSTSTTTSLASTAKPKQEYYIYIAAMWNFVRDWAQDCRLSSEETTKIKCRFSRDKSVIDKSDAVVFLARGSYFYENLKYLTSRKRIINQQWVMVNRESPLNVNSNTLAALNGLANWTMTYMKSSDVRFGYYDVIPGKFKGGFDSTRNYLEGRTKMAAILVSNCVQHRMQWIHKLQQYIDVTVLGNCGTRCSDCNAELVKHKFYLSFENSYCRDYVTEKPFKNGFMNLLVPVVIANVDFNDSTFLPPNSVIKAVDFGTVKELADYMKKVASDSSLYNEYFKWHSQYNIKLSDHGAYCELCRRAANVGEKQSVYNRVDDWFSRSKLCASYPTPH